MSTAGVQADGEFEQVLRLEPQRRISVAEYHLMIEAGILDEDEHVELLEGVIVEASPQSEAHAHAIQYLNRVLVRSLGDELFVRPQLPLTLGDWSEPEPDLAVVRVADLPSRKEHPRQALLAVEVALDSLRKDRLVKASLYARFGIPEYWIVDVARESVEVYRDPDPAARRYARQETVRGDDRLAPSLLPQVDIRVADIFA